MLYPSKHWYFARILLVYLKVFIPTRLRIFPNRKDVNTHVTALKGAKTDRWIVRDADIEAKERFFTQKMQSERFKVRVCDPVGGRTHAKTSIGLGATKKQRESRVSREVKKKEKFYIKYKLYKAKTEAEKAAYKAKNAKNQQKAERKPYYSSKNALVWVKTGKQDKRTPKKEGEKEQGKLPVVAVLSKRSLGKGALKNSRGRLRIKSRYGTIRCSLKEVQETAKGVCVSKAV